MDIVIEFFRDTLDGPFYIVWVVVCVILIFACIGYLAEKGIKNKKEKEKYATVSDTNNTDVVQEAVVSESVSTTQVTSTPVTTPVSEPVTNASIVGEVPTSDAGVVQNSVTSQPEVQAVNSSLNTTPTVSEVTTAPVENVNTTVPQVEEVNATVVQPVEVTQPNNVVAPTVVSPQIEPTTNVVNSPSNEVNNVVIPTINQDGNNNTV